jgi:hypothetical protein
VSQNVSPIAERSWIAGERIIEGAAWAAALMLLPICAILLQSRLGADTDVHWLTDLAGRWLDGRTPYVDFVEINPPASILLYVLPTALARAFGLSPDAVTQACVLAAGIAELAIAVAVARRARLLQEFGTVGLFWAAAAVFLLPGSAFAERDHFALIFALPAFAILPARALARPVDAHWAIAGGLGAGCMLCLRPHYVLALAPPALYALYRMGWRRGAAFLPEIISCTLVLALYVATVLVVFPRFVTDMLPMDVAVYAHGGAPFGWLLDRAWLFVWIFLAVALWGTRRAVIDSMPAQLLVLASGGALASYLLQDKGWPYHIYVADALIVASFGIANRAALRQTGLAALALALAWVAVSVVLVFAFLAPDGTSFVVLRVVVFSAFALLSARLALTSSDNSGQTMPQRWTRLGVAAIAVAAGQMTMLQGAHPPYFAAEMAALGPRPKIALVSGDGANGIDLANQTGGIYVPRVFAMNILELATNLARRGGLPLAAETTLSRYIREDRDRLAATVRNDRPDAIVIDPDWARIYLDPAFLHNLLDGYRLRATTKLPERFQETHTLQLFSRDPGP